MLPIKEYFNNPTKLFLSIVMKLNFLFPDKLYLKILYRLKMGRKLNLYNPMRFSEKLQWLKLYNRYPQYTKMVDKCRAKEYVAQIIGKEYIIPTLGEWDSFDEVDFRELPNKFVLKTNHSGGSTGVIICKDKLQFDIKKAKYLIEKSLKTNIYNILREWPYKNIKPKVFAEQLLEEDGPYGLMDYKVFCFNGEPKLIKVNYHVQARYRVNWYDVNWNRVYGTTIYDPTDMNIDIEKPALLSELLAKARMLSMGIPYLRVDFYYNKGRLLFGELTFFPGSGFEQFEPDSYDVEIGRWIKLPIEDGKQ